MDFIILLLVYLAVISLISVITVISDKKRAEKGKWRVPEAALFVLAILGGSAAMYFTMCLVRHKTQKNRFVFGIPMIFFLQSFIIYLILQALGIDIVV